MPQPIDWLLAMQLHDDAIAQRDREELLSQFQSLSQWSHTHRGVELEQSVRQALLKTYQLLGPSSRERYQLLMVLAAAGGSADLSLLADILVEDPPSESAAAVAPLVPLLHECRHPAALFPRLLEALENPSLAAAILDLANHFLRCGRVSRHPAADHSGQLMRLLDSLTSQLERIQSAQASPAAQQQVGDSLAIVISACDSLGLIGDRRATRVLEQVAALQHRRLRVEALAALGRLSQSDAITRLAAMAAEPSVRLRVLAYLEGLDALPEVEEVHQSPLAVAEAELVTFLTEPTQFGIPPTECQLMDHTTLVWPGYEEPRGCYLFAFVYRGRRGEETYSLRNIGLAGPVTMAFPDDLTRLSPRDCYAIFAGWHAEHAEIRPVDWQATEVDRAICNRLVASLAECDYESLRPELMYRFFGTDVLAVRGERQGRPGLAVTDERIIHWFPDHPSGPAFSPERALDWYRGQRLLSLFNDNWEVEDNAPTP